MSPPRTVRIRSGIRASGDGLARTLCDAFFAAFATGGDADTGAGVSATGAGALATGSDTRAVWRAESSLDGW